MLEQLTLDPRVSPEILDTQESILGFLLKNPEEIPKFCQVLKVNYFSLSEYRIIYQAMLDLAAGSLPIDAIQIEAHLSANDLLNIAGGVKFIYRIAGENKLVRQPSKASIYRSIERTIEQNKRIELKNKVAKFYNEIDCVAISMPELRETAEAFILDFLRSSVDEGQGLVPISETIETTLENTIELTHKIQNGIVTDRIDTGWPDLDKLTGGWGRGDLIVVAARTSVGKSAYLGNALLHIARSRPVALFSLEMPTPQIERRYLAIEANVDSSKIRDGLLSPQEIDRMVSASARLSTLQYWGNDRFTANIDFVLAECRRLAAKQGDLGGIGIDYLQLLARLSANNDLHREVGRITAKLKNLAVELNCPIFCLSQLNRAVETRNDKRPNPSDLRESGSIEEDADSILFLYRDEYYNPTTIKQGIAEIIIAKNRNGSLGTIELLFDKKTTKFKSVYNPNQP